MKKQIISIITLLAVLISMLSISVMADDEKSANSVHEFWINDSTVSVENLKAITDEQGINCVPIRAIAEKLEFNIEWDAENQIVKLDKGGIHIQIRIGDNFVTKNDDIIQLNTTVKIIDDFTYIPTRFVSKILENI